MHNIIADLHYVDVHNCFLHLSSDIFYKFESLLSKYVKGFVVKSQKIIYLSVSGEICRNLPHGSVGLSPVYASTLDLSPGDKLVLTILNSASSLSKITAYPFSEDDRFILEISSGEVEARLLSQLRIVWSKQCFPVWISPTITVKLIVDKLFPEVCEFGQLEEHTELVVGDVKSADKLLNKNVESQGLSDDEQHRLEERAPTNEVQFEKIICRAVPEEDDCPPYRVRISPDECPNWLKSRETGSVFELTACVAPFSKVIVSVDVEQTNVPDIGLYKSLSAPLTVLHHLNVSCGNNVSLSPVTSHQDQLSSLLITPCQLLKKQYPLNEVENMFRTKLSTLCMRWGRCLLNTKGIFPLDNGTSVSVTLRPLNLTWAYVTLISLYNLPISVNTVETNDSGVVENSTKEECGDGQERNFVGQVFSHLSKLVEHSLGLKNGLNRYHSLKNNFLLIGKHGTGKTHISDCLVSVLSKSPYYVHFETISCTSLKGKRIENVGKILNAHLNICKSKQPSVFLIENIEIICGTFSPELEKSEAAFHIQRVSQKVADILEGNTSDSSVLIFATCESISSVNSAIFKRRGKSVFSTLVPIQSLTHEERSAIMKGVILNRSQTTENSLSDLDFEYYVSLTDGYVASDLIKFIEKAIFEASQRYNSSQNGAVLNAEDLKKAYDSSSSFMHNKLKVQRRSEVKLSDVGGLHEVKEKLTQLVIWPSKYSLLLNQCPLRKQTGLLLYGAPGSGKTLLARAIANQSNLNFITVKGPELMSKYIGESEEGVRRVFDNAQAAKPSLLFFDEFESLAPRRGEEQTGVTDRVVNQLLTALDGVEPIAGVTVIAASSRPDLIDPALLRSGRLSHHLFCSYPNKIDRIDILRKLSCSIDLAEDVDFEALAEFTDNFSGADLKGLLTTAQIQVLDRLVEVNNRSEVFTEGSKNRVIIRQRDLLSALEQTRPSLSDKDRLRFDYIYKLFSKGKMADVTNQRAIFA